MWQSGHIISSSAGVAQREAQTVAKELFVEICITKRTFCQPSKRNLERLQESGLKTALIRKFGLQIGGTPHAFRPRADVDVRLLWSGLLRVVC